MLYTFEDLETGEVRSAVPLFKADSATLTFSASKDGKLRVTCTD